MTYEEDRESRLHKMRTRLAAAEPLSDLVREIWRIHFDLDCWQPLAGHAGVWELKRGPVERLVELRGKV